MSHDQITNAGAVGAISSPVWLPNLKTISAAAAEILPILGAIWLLTQIITKIIETRRNKNNKR